MTRQRTIFDHHKSSYETERDVGRKGGLRSVHEYRQLHQQAHTPFSYPAPRITSQKSQAVPQKIKKEALEEEQKQSISETKLNQEKLSNLIDKSSLTLFKCAAEWPFDLFPDEVTVEPTQINIKRKSFFLTESIVSIPIKNVADVVIQTSILFASLNIVDKSFTQNTVTVEYLNRADAEKARRIIQGLVVASKEGIDLLKLDLTNLKMKLEEIGQAEFERPHEKK